jgi:hypothetical protein
MRKIQRAVSLAVVLLSASAAAASAGQHPAAKAGEQVIITQAASGEELQGHLVELSSTSLAILVDDGRRVEIPVENVLRIDVRNDSLKNGAIIGGAIMGGITGLGCIGINDAAACATVLVLNTGFGVLAGMGIDALHRGRTPIYVKAGKSESSLQVKIRF